MLRATAGVWLNYATTLVFQILFAKEFGAGGAASAFVVVYGIAIGLGGFLNTGMRGVLVPRLVNGRGEVISHPLRTVGMVVAAAALIALTVFALPSPFASLVEPHVRLSHHQLVEMFRLTAVFMFTQVMAGALSTVSLARGRRFVPSGVLAIPSITASVYMVLRPHASITQVYLLLNIGAVGQIGALIVSANRGIRIVPGTTGRVGLLTSATVIVTGLLSLVPPVERVMASIDSPAGGAQYFYASRALAVAQQLLVGGALLSALGTWSQLRAQGREVEFKRSVARTMANAALLFVLGGSLALVAGHDLVQVVYQRGQFGATDTAAVTSLLLLSLGGFAAEGLVLVLSQALLAAQLNRVTLSLGVVNVALRMALIFLLAHLWGADGVAIAWTASATFVFAVQGWFALKKLGHPEPRHYGPVSAVCVGTFVTAAVLRWVHPAGVVVATSLVLLVFAGLCFLLRARLALPLPFGAAR